jgi:hypothetical protein
MLIGCGWRWAAYLARFKVTSRDHTDSCAAISPDVPEWGLDRAWSRSWPGARIWSCTSGGCRRSAGSTPRRSPGGSRPPRGSTGPVSSTASWNTPQPSTFGGAGGAGRCRAVPAVPAVPAAPAESLTLFVWDRGAGDLSGLRSDNFGLGRETARWRVVDWGEDAVARELCYTDAVRLLGGQDEKVVASLDLLVGGLVRAASVTGAGFVLSLFDPSSPLVRLSNDLVRGLRERASGLSRVSRSERLAAAHAVVVLVAYFESVSAVSLPFRLSDLELTRSEQVSLAGGGAPGPGRAGDLAAALLLAGVPMPAPQWPYEITLLALGGFYRHLSHEVVRFTEGLEIWDRLDDRRRDTFRGALLQQVPDQAVSRYEEFFRDLATQYPEFAFWANMVDQRATRAEVRRLHTGMAELKEMLETISVGEAPDRRRAALATAYQAVLRRPVLLSQEMPEGLRMPTLSEAYINPSFRAAQVDDSDGLARESWWEQHPVRDDLHKFLAGHLTSRQACYAPLLVLGQPGSGKSVLTKVLAAQLPASQFLAVRVALREVPADADLQTQIEFAIRSETGERLEWPALSRSADGALPVIMLDGFDELLQATGASQSDYLEKVADFQRREADLGRPTAVLITSRTVVADRARGVADTVAVRLEPFGDAQVRDWVGIWNSRNAAALAARGRRDLDAASVLAQPELASQPLLLVMLAIYDAEANALHDRVPALQHGELYESLLRRFADREVRKAASALPDADIRQAVDDELLRLSVVAFAMFIRGRQWVTAAELDADLPALLAARGEAHHPRSGLRAPLTVSETVIGRFFFVYEARAVRDNQQLRTYEFLHATFAEYLIGRLIANELTDIAAAAQLTSTRPRPADDAFLHALLSFVALTARSTAVTFLAEQIKKISDRHRQALPGLLLGVFWDALLPRREGPYDNYQPVSVPAPARHAAYSANLLLLIVLIGGEVTAQQLYPGSADPVPRWRRAALLWRSQLTAEGWNGLIHTIQIKRTWNEAERGLRISLGDDSTPTPNIDPFWSYNRGPASGYRHAHSRWRYYGFNDLRRHSYFVCDPVDDTAVHAIEPFAAMQDPPIGTFHGLAENLAVSSANALITLWLTAAQPTVSSEKLAAAHEACLSIALQTIYFDESLEAVAQKEFCTLSFRQLVADQHRLPKSWLSAALKRISVAGVHNSELSHLAYPILGDLLTTGRSTEVVMSMLSEAEIHNTLSSYRVNGQFTKASRLLKTQRLLILCGPVGTSKRTSAIAMLNENAVESITAFPASVYLEDIASHEWRSSCGYIIVDWNNGSPAAQEQALVWRLIREQLNRASAYLVITVSDQEGLVPYFRWRPATAQDG